MAAVYDNSVEAFSASASTTLETASWAVGGSNRYLLVFVGSGAGTPVDPSAVKWGGSGGTSLTQKGSTLNMGTNAKWSCWELIAPTAQTSTVHVTWGSSQDERWIIAISFTTTDQTTPTRTVATATGTSTAPSVNATSVSGDLVVDGVAFLDTDGGSRTLTVGASQTSRQEIEGADLVYEGAGVSTEAATGTSTTMSWSMSGSGGRPWATFAMALIESAAAAAPAPNVNESVTVAEDVTMKMHLQNMTTNDSVTVAEVLTMHMPISLKMEKLS